VRVLAYLLAGALVALLSGCVQGSPEDRAFFNQGWVNPEAGADARILAPQ